MMAWMANVGPDPSWPRFAVSPSLRAWPRWRWGPSTTTQTHLPHRRPPSSGQSRHRRVRQETPTNNLGVYARTGTRRTTRPKIGHAIIHHEPELRGMGPTSKRPTVYGMPRDVVHHKPSSTRDPGPANTHRVFPQVTDHQIPPQKQHIKSRARSVYRRKPVGAAAGLLGAVPQHRLGDEVRGGLPLGPQNSSAKARSCCAAKGWPG
jgi:hypothetical protein